MKNINKIALTTLLTLIALPALAADGSGAGMAAFGSGLGIGIAVLGGALGQSKAAAAALEGIARNPAAQGQIFVPMIIGLALMESLVILAFLVAGGFVGQLS